MYLSNIYLSIFIVIWIFVSSEPTTSILAERASTFWNEDKDFSSSAESLLEQPGQQNVRNSVQENVRSFKRRNTRSTFKKDEKCQIDSACNRLLDMGLCVERFQKKLEQKCPSFCDDCGSGYIGKNKKLLPNIILENLDLVDAELNETLYEITLARRNSFLSNSLVMNNLQHDIISMFAASSNYFDQTDKANLIRSINRKNSLNPLSPKPTHTKNVDQTHMKDQITALNEITKAENEEWKLEEYHQLREDQAMWAERDLAASRKKQAFTFLYSIPYFGSNWANLAMKGVDEVERLYELENPRKTENDIYNRLFDKKLDQMKNLTTEIAINTEKHLNELYKNIVKANAALHETTREMAKANLLNILNSLNSMKNQLTDRIGLGSMHNSRDSYTGIYRLQLNKLLAKYEDYVISGMSANKAELFRTACARIEIRASTRTLASHFSSTKLAFLVDSSQGNIAPLRNHFGEMYSDLELYNMLLPICTNLLDYTPEEGCDIIQDTTELISRVQNSMLSELENYYKNSKTRAAIIAKIHTSVKDAFKIMKDLQGTVEVSLNELSSKFPDLRFLVYGKQVVPKHPSNFYKYEELEYNRDIILFNEKVLLENYSFNILVHTIDSELDGEIWEKCYDGNLSTSTHWYTNRPKCVHSGITVQKNGAKCDLRTGETIPRHTDSKLRDLCFALQPVEDLRDPVSYLSSLLTTNPVVKHDRPWYQAQSMMAIGEILDPEFIFYKLNNDELAQLKLNYVCEAVLYDFVKDDESFHYATNMNGAVSLWSYYFDAAKQRLIEHHTMQVERANNTILLAEEHRNDILKQFTRCDILDEIEKPLCYELNEIGLKYANADIEKNKNILHKLSQYQESLGRSREQNYVLLPSFRISDTIVELEPKDKERIEQIIKTVDYLEGTCNINFRIYPKEIFYHKQIALISKSPRNIYKMKELPGSTFKNECIIKTKKNKDLNAKFQKQMDTFMKKIKAREESNGTKSLTNTFTENAGELNVGLDTRRTLAATKNLNENVDFE